MTGGICFLSLVAVRSRPAETADMVNQLLFGDLFELIEQQGSWLFIRTLHDQYTGWCNQNQLTLLNNETLEVLLQSSYELVNSPVATLGSSGQPPLFLTFGSKLYVLSSGGFAGPQGSYALHEGMCQSSKSFDQSEMNEMAISWLKVPYLWGGRSPFGVDCSGFIQLLFAIFGIALKRDARDQVLQGQLVGLIEESQAGDVAFFDDDEGNIVHTGLITGSGSIIHASGCVRLDHLDHHGIYDKSIGKYTHKLRTIRRITQMESQYT
ncbi:MAG: NlpC/P60 family protein [Lentimicrobiaceae bacterium]|nr:NlpC/P60 family protein [Lentimicrobiaceae bacterium]